ncbi:MAG: TRAP transporter small permease, partial [Burkholderiales bacterium]|nr:TRAP transporter small permease [Burkholderiales bacterium]
AMTLLTFAQVVARYVFGYSYTWALEATGVMFAWLIFVGMAYGVRIGAHIGVDIVVRKLGARAARAAALLASALCIAYALIVAWGATQYVVKIHDVGILMQDLPVPSWIPRLVLPLGYALLALRFGQIGLRLLRGERASLLGDEAEDALRHRDLAAEEAEETGEAARGGGTP